MCPSVCTADCGSTFHGQAAGLAETLESCRCLRQYNKARLPPPLRSFVVSPLSFFPIHCSSGFVLVYPLALYKQKRHLTPAFAFLSPESRNALVMEDHHVGPVTRRDTPEESTYVGPADDLAKGVIPTAKQSLRDLFIWNKRVVVSNAYGETRCEWHKPDKLKNPISLFAQLSAKDWLFFLVGLLAWTADAFDFHALSIQTVKLHKYYGKEKSDVTTAITLTLLLRSVGAAFFGLAGDKWGRKWPMVANMIILGLLQIATIYSATFQQFLAVRSLFGLFMGGVYGNAIAMALEQCP